MSAFIVSEFHVKLIAYVSVNRIEYLFHEPGYLYVSKSDIEKATNILYRANFKSVNIRYPDNKTKYIPITITDKDIEKIQSFLDRQKNFRLLTLVKLCHCFEYQSNEYDGWERSPAKRILDKLKLKLLDRLAYENPNYDNLPWAVD